MPFATNAIDGVHTYYEDDGGEGTPIVFYPGFMDPLQSCRDLPLAKALGRQFRLVFADHRGHGRSDKPHDAAAYALRLRVADAAALLDALGVERAHFIGISWGARLGFAIGEAMPERVASLVLCGNQPYGWDFESPIALAVTEGMEAAREQGMQAMLERFEAYAGGPFPERERVWLLDNDPIALHAAFASTRNEGVISPDLRRWRIPTLIIAGDGDEMFEDARRAAAEIPDARFISLPNTNHLSALNDLLTVLPQIEKLLST